uniref:Uncharacterized protein n=1 Tax=Neolamprologus brichardi TaxID=32507 RepID=A0A3Q4GTQ1_NEOBR
HIKSAQQFGAAGTLNSAQHVVPSQHGQVSDYGLFPFDEDPRKEMQRPQKIKMLDGAFNTIMVNDIVVSDIAESVQH